MVRRFPFLNVTVSRAVFCRPFHLCIKTLRFVTSFFAATFDGKFAGSVLSIAGGRSNFLISSTFLDWASNVSLSHFGFRLRLPFIWGGQM
jgi:hypothetical protein